MKQAQFYISLIVPCACGLLASIASAAPLALPQTCSGYDAAFAPSKRADSLHGFKVDDLWQACGTVWTAVSVSRNAASWQKLQITGLPTDYLGEGVVFSGGTTRLVSGYVGPALDVRLSLHGQSQVVTLPLTQEGHLDSRLLQQRDAGTSATVLKVYDQSGHGNHLLATTGKEVVHVGEVKVGQDEALSWGEANGPGGFILPSSMKVSANNFFFSTIGGFSSSNSGHAAYPVPLLLGLGGAGHELKVYFGGYQLDGFVHVSDPFNPDQILNLVVNNTNSVFSIWSHKTTYSVQSGNTQSVGHTQQSAAFLQGGYIGYNADGGQWFEQGPNTGLWTGIVLANAVDSAHRIQMFRASAALHMQQTPQNKSAVVTIGDSRTEGYLVADGQNWPWLMQQKGQYQSYNLAVSGATSRHMLAMLPAAKTIAAQSDKHIAIVFGGFNDHLPQNKISYTETVHNLAQIVDTLQKMSYYVILVSESQTDPVLRQQLVDALSHGSLHPNVVVDPFSQGMPLFDLHNTTYWHNDFTHPTAAGQVELANFLWPSVSEILQQERP